MKFTYKDQELPVDLRAGDVLIFRNEFELKHPVTLLSGVIRFFTECPYNHAALVVENNGDLFVNEALAGGVTARPLEKYLYRGKKTYIGVLRPQTPVVNPVDFSRDANVYVGTKYDFASLVFHHTVYRIPKLLGFKRFGKWMGSTNQFALSKLVCSEYVALMFGLPKWWLMSTADLIDSGYFEVVWEEKAFLG